MIELNNKIIEIPPKLKYLMAGEEREIVIKVSKTLFTTEKENSNFILIVKNNDGEAEEIILDYLGEDDLNFYYKWNLNKEKTIEGKLFLQFKIIRTLEETEDKENEIDPDFLVPYGDDTNGVWYSTVNFIEIDKSLQ